MPWKISPYWCAGLVAPRAGDIFHVAILTCRDKLLIASKLGRVHAQRSVVRAIFPFAECPLNGKHRLGVEIGRWLAEIIRRVIAASVLGECRIANIVACPADIGIAVER